MKQTPKKRLKVEVRPQVTKKVSHSGMTPVASEESVEEVTPEYKSDSSEDEAEEYKNNSYWALPENVRHAIDLSKKKSRHSDFYSKLTSLNDKIGVYKKIFYTNAPKFE